MSKTAKEMYEERVNRVRAAVALQPVDRIPTMSAGPAVYAAFQGVALGDYLNDMELNCDVNLKACLDFNVDGSQAPIFTPEVFPLLWFSKTKVPGKDLKNNELWQVAEEELITEEDYDRIEEVGYEQWRGEFLQREFPEFPERTKGYMSYMPTALKRYAEAGVPVWVGSITTSPFEHLCGGRSLATFLVDDLMEEPDRMERILDMVHEVNMKEYRAIFENPETRPLGVWVGGWRGTPTMLSREMFLRFSWKYLKEVGNLCIEYGVIPIFHLDSDWTPCLDVFKEIEAGKAIIAIDGKTDIYKAKEILGGHMCIMGDVPAEKLAFGTAKEVYDYSVKLIREIGPTGFILCSGCDIPYNAKEENVRAMIQAIDDTEGTL